MTNFNYIFKHSIPAFSLLMSYTIFLLCRFGSRDCGLLVENRELNKFPESRQTTFTCGDPDIQDYLQQAVEQNGFQQPHDWESVSELYITLKDIAGL